MKEKLRQRIIELIHGVPYDEAVKKENTAFTCKNCGSDNLRTEDFKREQRRHYCGECKETTPFVDYDTELQPSIIGEYKINPITIGRVMQALKNK